MLVIDASSLYEVLTDGRHGGAVRTRLGEDDDHAAPHIIDAEVMGVLRRDAMRGDLDLTSARLAILGLRDWRGQRFGHTALLERAWELRANVRGWDALYVALAEALGATLITLDRRLSRAPGLRCSIEVVGSHP